MGKAEKGRGERDVCSWGNNVDTGLDLGLGIRKLEF